MTVTEFNSSVSRIYHSPTSKIKLIDVRRDKLSFNQFINCLSNEECNYILRLLVKYTLLRDSEKRIPEKLIDYNLNKIRFFNETEASVIGWINDIRIFERVYQDKTGKKIIIDDSDLDMELLTRKFEKLDKVYINASDIS